MINSSCESLFFQAMILAAGYGKRMLPITKVIPKPLVIVNEKPIIHHIIEKLFLDDIHNITVNTHHLSHKLKKYINKSFQEKLNIIHERKILETGGGVSNALKKNYINLNHPLLVINGDIFWIDKGKSIFQKLKKKWDEKSMDILLVLVEKKKIFGYEGKGDFNFYDNDLRFGKVNNFKDDKKFVYAGIQLVNPNIFSNYTKKKYSFTKIFNNLIDINKIFGMVDSGRWFHIGTIKDLNQAEKIIMRLK